MTSATRRQMAMVALAAVLGGTLAGDAETEIIDFKEEQGSRGPGGVRQVVPATHEPAAVALASEVACLANGDHGGVLVVGVDDRQAGQAAFTGAHLDPQWLRGRLYALTQPSYTVQIEQLTFTGVNLLLIDVPPALELIRSGGKLRTRVGRACLELTADRAADLIERRRGYDWSAQPSGWRFSQIDRAALLSARRKYQTARGIAPVSARRS